MELTAPERLRNPPAGMGDGVSAPPGRCDPRQGPLLPPVLGEVFQAGSLPHGRRNPGGPAGIEQEGHNNTHAAHEFFESAHEVSIAHVWPRGFRRRAPRVIGPWMDVAALWNGSPNEKMR